MGAGLIELDAAVYAVRSRKNGATYVGGSSHVTKRLETHVRLIANGSHPSRRVCEEFAGHDKADLETLILERVKVYVDPETIRKTQYLYWQGMDRLAERERHWIRELQPSGNIQGRTRPACYELKESAA